MLKYAEQDTKHVIYCWITEWTYFWHRWISFKHTPQWQMPHRPWPKWPNKFSERACKSHGTTSQLNGWWSGLGNSPFLLGGTVHLWITTSGCPDWEGEMPQQERCLQGILIFVVRCSLFCLVRSAEMAWHLNNRLYLILCFMFVCISTLVLILSSAKHL